METANEEIEQQERHTDVIWSLSYSLSSIETIASNDDDEEEEENSDHQKPRAKATAAVVKTENDYEFEHEQSIIMDQMIQPSDNTCDRDNDHKAMINQLIVHKTASFCVSSSAAAASHEKSPQQDGAAANEHDHVGQISAVHAAALHPDNTTQRVVKVEQPQVKDVLFGRCKQAKTHSGNHMLRAICDHKRRIYDLADRDDKTEITRSIVHEIKSSGGSFLKFSKTLQVWLEVDDDEARQKVSHMMRNGRLQPLGRLEPEMFPLPPPVTVVTEKGSISADEPS